jgi:phage tail sheath protein FI
VRAGNVRRRFVAAIRDDVEVFPMAAFTFPGVYIEEIPSGVHTITGVATSIAAFIGWANTGPTDHAVLVQSWSEFEDQFGGLSNDKGTPNYLGYAVNHFFANGGSQAYIIRLVANSAVVAAHATDTLAVAASVPIPAGGGTAFTVTAIDEGQWANDVYGIRIVVNPADANRFSLLVVYTPAGGQETTVETFANLSINPSDPQGRSITSVVNDPLTGSQLVRVSGAGANLPTPNPLTIPPAKAPYALGAGAGSKKGVDGTVLVPGAADFHTALNADGTGSGGVHLLDTVPIFNLLCVPGETSSTVISNLQSYCRANRAFYIVDCASNDTVTSIQGKLSGISGNDSVNSALYFPWLNAPDPLQQGRLNAFPPSGFVAGLYAATDATRGVWKAPAGIDASLTGESGPAVLLTDLQNGTLNVQAVNCIRHFPVYGDVIWGARTLRGNDQVGSEWKYVPIRRLALFLESSLYQGTQWVVFEPNDERLWSQIRLNVGAFMQGLFLQGAFQGTTPQQAFFVKCDAENNPQSSIDQGVVNILVGFAPLYPAEFVVIQIQQMAGQL